MLNRNALALPLAFGLLIGSSLTAQSGTARYELTFRSNWSAATHPISFPSSAHYSSLVGATHTGAVRFWEPGGIATSGIESMAETGSTVALRREVQAAINAGPADQTLLGGALAVSPGTLTYRFTADADYPLLTLVTMVAPSPDWFVGLHGFDLAPNGVWVDDVTLDLPVYDAGTDSGLSYTSRNADVTPHRPIARVTQAVGPLVGAPISFGTFHLRRLSSESLLGCGVNPAGSVSVTGQARPGQNVTIRLDDPTGTAASPSMTALLIATSPIAAFPCGVTVPGFGLGAPGSGGEFLLGSVIGTLAGASWSGAAVPIGITIPSGLNGSTIYTQGVIFGAQRIGLTDGVALSIGN